MEITLTPSEFYALLGVHKQEAAEGMVFITAFTAIALAIMAYLGSARKVTFPARIFIIICFVTLAYCDWVALTGSRDLHQAIHVEIQKCIEEKPRLIHSQEFRDNLKDMELPPERVFTYLHIFFDVLMVCAIIMIGKGNLIDFLEERKNNYPIKKQLRGSS